MKKATSVLLAMIATIVWPLLPYLGIDQMLDLMEPRHRFACRSLIDRFPGEVKNGPGSRHNHQWWRGGYLAHVLETMNFGLWLMQLINHLRPGLLTFSRSSLLFVLFWHDVDKLGKYEWHEGKWLVIPERRTTEGKYAFRDSLLRELGVVLTDEEANALKYVEGEGADYSPDGPKMGQLAAIAHICDVWSARVAPASPTADDPWGDSRQYAERK